jgi:thiamine biosynthesis lipoprotein
MKKTLSIFLAFAIAFCFTACSGNATKNQKFTSSFLDLFDTASTITAYDVSKSAFDKNFEKMHSELQKYDNLFDIYNSYDGITNLCTVNQNAGKAPVKVGSEIIELLKYGKQIYDLSEGKTNICFGSVLSLWHNAREVAENGGNAKLPSTKDLQNANNHTNIDDLVIDEENSTVFFNDEKMQLDVGAIAKGFAVEKITEWAKQNLWQSAVINIGGNVSAFGYKNNDGKTPWAVGIENPQQNGDDYLFKLNVANLSVVTSGDYQRYYVVNGKKYCHIINPQTLMPSEYVASVTVVCNSSSLADALSTTLFNMSIDDGKKLVESMSGVEAVWVDKNYESTYSSGFDEYLD